MTLRLIPLAVPILLTAAGCGKPTSTTAPRSAAKTAPASNTVPPALAAPISETDKELSLGTQLRASVSTLQSYSTSFQKTADSAANRLRESLKGEVPNGAKLGMMASAWEQDWKDVGTHAQSLKEQQQSVTAAEARLWAKMTEINGTITDPKLKERDKAANDKRKAEWQACWGSACKRVELASQVVERGKNLHRVLKNSALRGELVDCMDVLNSIEADTKAVTKDLTILSEQVQLLEGLIGPNR
jgi:hypothetical protein